MMLPCCSGGRSHPDKYYPRLLLIVKIEPFLYRLEHTVIIPDRNPCKAFVAIEQIEIGLVRCNTLAIIVKRVDLSIR